MDYPPDYLQNRGDSLSSYARGDINLKLYFAFETNFIRATLYIVI